MKYFIDFEATQFSNEIISVGCVREDGETFYSLVNVQRNKITPFITDLTGISKNDVEIAPSSDEVFENLYNWLSQDKSKAQFFCYGNNDIGFIRRNLNKTNSIKAQMALSLIAFNLIDYSKAVVRHFGLIKSIALVKVLAYYRQEEEIEQNHNALEDALFLKEIYEKIDEEEDIVDCPFPGYEKPVFTSNSISAPRPEKEQGLKINRKLSITVDKFMNEEMEFPETFEEFAKEYGFQDDKIYHFAQRLFYCYLNMTAML